MPNSINKPPKKKSKISNDSVLQVYYKTFLSSYIRWKGADQYLLENLENPQNVQFALKIGASSNPKDDTVISPLVQAINLQQAGTIKVLLKNGSNPLLLGKYICARQERYDEGTPLNVALQTGNQEIITLVQNAILLPDFIHALENQNIEKVREILHQGMDTTQKLSFFSYGKKLTALEYAISKKNPELVACIVAKEQFFDDEIHSIINLASHLDKHSAQNYLLQVLPYISKKIMVYDDLPLAQFIHRENFALLPLPHIFDIINSPLEHILSGKYLNYKIFESSRLQALEILYLKKRVAKKERQEQENLANNTESAMSLIKERKVVKLFEEKIRPYYDNAFKNHGGLLKIEAAIRDLILTTMLEDSTVSQKAKSYIREHRSNLIQGNNKKCMDTVRTFLNSSTDITHIAWRGYDSWAPVDTNFGENLLTETNDIAIKIRTMVAYYYLGIVDDKIQPEFKQDRVGNFFVKLAEIRRANCKKNSEIDTVSCYPGHLTRIADMGRLHPILECPEFPLEELFQSIVTMAFNRNLSQIPSHDLESKKKFYESLILLQEQTARDIILGKIPYSSELLDLRKSFIMAVFGNNEHQTRLKIHAELTKYSHAQEFLVELNSEYNKLRMQYFKANITHGKIANTITNLYNASLENPCTIDTAMVIIQQILLQSFEKPKLVARVKAIFDTINKVTLISEREVFIKEVLTLIKDGLLKESLMEDFNAVYSLNMHKQQLVKQLEYYASNPKSQMLIFNAIDMLVGDPDKLLLEMDRYQRQRNEQIKKLPAVVQSSQLNKLTKQKNNGIQFVNALTNQLPQDVIRYNFKTIQESIHDFIAKFGDFECIEINNAEWANFVKEHAILKVYSAELFNELTLPKISKKRTIS